ncbi:MAG: thioredoxin domain-containing protein [Candidatus Ancillula sp.]|jgi:protein-disulfide isomerase|nr:thioredoxin domain-containing protein [Candidatus Ancillula sp.]
MKNDPEIILNVDQKSTSVEHEVVVYVDFLCPFCGMFQSRFSEKLRELVDRGTISLQYRAIAWIDQYSNGYHYSARAALAAQKLNESQSDLNFRYITKLFVRGVQPHEGQRFDPALAKFASLAALADEVGASDATVKNIAALEFDPNLEDTLIQAQLAKGHELREKNVIPSTPSFFVDGELLDEFERAKWLDAH